MTIFQELLEPSWKKALEQEFQKPYFLKVDSFLKEEEKKGYVVYPRREHIFQAFDYTPFYDVRVVVMGQDPYHGPGQAHGLSFSVPKGTAAPPSLKNIFKELKSDLGIKDFSHGCLSSWARQGVFLLNASLSVRASQANSHANCGWAEFTDAVIANLAKKETPPIFVLWGRFAQEKCKFLDQRHFLLKAAHPSPFSANNGFFNCRHFSKINEILRQRSQAPIEWALR